jgi:hypothetical protein
VEHLPGHRSAPPGVARRVAADAPAEAVFHRDGQLAVGQGRESSGGWDAKVVVAQGGARQEYWELPQARPSSRVQAQRVSRPEAQQRELPQARVPRRELASRRLALRQAAQRGQVSPPLVLQPEALREPQLELELRALPLPVDALQA